MLPAVPAQGTLSNSISILKDKTRQWRGLGGGGWDFATVGNKPNPIFFSPNYESNENKNFLEASLFRL